MFRGDGVNLPRSDTCHIKKEHRKLLSIQSWSTQPLSGTHTLQTIEKVQRRAARWVTNRHHQTSCINSIIDSLAWPTLQQRRKKARLEMFYKFHHRLVTIDSEYLPQPTENRSIHRKNNTHSYNIPYCRTQYRHMSFFPRTIPKWNSLPQEIVAAKSLDCFKSRLAAHL